MLINLETLCPCFQIFLGYEKVVDSLVYKGIIYQARVCVCVYLQLRKRINLLLLTERHTYLTMWYRI